MRSPFVSPGAGKNTLSRLVTATSRSPTFTTSLCAERRHHFRDPRRAGLGTFRASDRLDVLLAARERERVEGWTLLHRRERSREIARDHHSAFGAVRLERHMGALTRCELRRLADVLAGR